MTRSRTPASLDSYPRPDGFERGSAFPNAYISTDEPPRRSALRAALCVTAMVGIGFLGLVILVLSLFSTDYSPVTQVASDYGVGRYALEMNAGFFLAGVGMLSLAVVTMTSNLRRSARVGGALLLPGGVALILNAFYQTDLEGAARTFHGLVHGLGGAVFFFTAPVALLLISAALGRRRFALTLGAFLAVVVALILNSAMALNASGLAERFLIGAVFSSAILTAFRTLRES